MNILEIEKGFIFLKTHINKQGKHPGDIIMKANFLIDSITRECEISEKDASILANIFISNEYITYDSSFIKLTEIGYELINNETWPIPRLELTYILPISNNSLSLDQLFYYLWDIIGNDKENNPYYVDGKTFYDLVRIYCIGLPPTYSDYIDELRLNKKNTSRNKWCKELFVSVGKGQIGSFLSKLSMQINQGIVKINKQNLPIEDEISSIEDIEDDHIELKTMKKHKNFKIFISHNTLDKPYAKALVDMLSRLGLNEEDDIFCSSVPGCGVKFGKSFIEAIRHQYEDYNLIILFIHSPRLYISPVSLNEMGAGWVLRSEYRSFLTSDCSFDMLKGVIPSSEIAFQARNKETYHLLHEFKELIERSFNLTPKGLGRWDEIRSDFIRAIESIKYT